MRGRTVISLTLTAGKISPIHRKVCKSYNKIE
jgi:hypothetical protein